jgi:hypothetical protein
MASYISFLRDMIDLPTLSYQTGISVRTLTSYQRGSVKPSGKTLDALKSVYANINATDLQLAGLPEREAFRFSTLSRSKVNSIIKQTNAAVQGVLKRVIAERGGEPLDAETENEIRYRFANSEKTAEELFDSP